MMQNLIIAVAMAMTLSAGTAWARGEGHGGGHHKGDEISPLEKHFSPKNMKDLGLTDEQKEKLKAIRQANRVESEKIREEMKAARKAFKESLRTSATKEDVTKAYQLMLDKKNQLSKSRLDSLLNARDILTDEQKAKLFGKTAKED